MALTNMAQAASFHLMALAMMSHASFSLSSQTLTIFALLGSSWFLSIVC